MTRSYYAGNGRDLIAFDRAAARDVFVSEHPSFYAETAREYRGGYRDYPQYRKCASDHHVMYDARGNRYFVNITTM